MTGIDTILITHEHPDHFHLESLQQVLENNPSATIFTNRGVGPLLKEAGISYELLEDGQNTETDGVIIEGHGKEHGQVHPLIPRVPNTGYLVADRFFYPGDAFVNPKKSVEILALPIAGPWMKMNEALDYAVELNPEACFPVHDGMLDPVDWIYAAPTKVLTEENNINFTVIKPGHAQEF